MNDEQNERRLQRHITEIEVTLYDPDGSVVDPNAMARDISASGFRAELRKPLEVGRKLRFEMTFDDGEKAGGDIQVAWAQADPWGGHIAGMKITKMSWRDSSRLRARVYRPGYDFVTMARKMFWGLYWIIVVAAVHNVVFHQKLTREVLWHLAPVAGALAVLGWALLMLLG